MSSVADETRAYRRFRHELLQQGLDTPIGDVIDDLDTLLTAHIRHIKTLERIAAAESGVWGQLAHRSLFPEETR